MDQNPVKYIKACTTQKYLHFEASICEKPIGHTAIRGDGEKVQMLGHLAHRGPVSSTAACSTVHIVPLRPASALPTRGQCACQF